MSSMAEAPRLNESENMKIRKKKKQKGEQKNGKIIYIRISNRGTSG